MTTTAGEEAARADSRDNGPGGGVAEVPSSKARLRAEALVRWPRYVKVSALCAVLAFAWLAAELVWPLTGIPTLAGVEAAGGTNTQAAKGSQPPDPSSFEQAFQARKLFVPEVPVESHELSRQAVDEQLSRMKLTAIIEQGGELVAWIEVGGFKESGSASGRSSTASTASSTETRCVKKGDFIGDFKVTDITPNRVDLKIAGFDAHLSY